MLVDVEVRDVRHLANVIAGLRAAPASPRWSGRAVAWTAAPVGAMILGIGSDICDIRRIERAMERHRRPLPRRACSPKPSARRASAAPSATSRAGTYAKRFAAKEACAKALGTGFRAGRVHVRSWAW